MKLFNKKTLSAALVAGALVLATAPASAFTASEVPGVSSGTVNLVVNGNVATVFGNVDSKSERRLIENYVKKNYDVNKVINLISAS